MILHTLNAGPDSQAFSDCLRFVIEGDAVLLTGDGVYASLENTAACKALCERGAELFALEPDVRAAGVLDRVCGDIGLASFNDFAALTERFDRQLAWY